MKHLPDLEEQLDRVRSRAWVANRQNSPIYTLFLTCGIFTAIVTLVLLGRITSPVSAPPMADLAVQANKASTLDEKVDVLFQAERVRMSKTFEEQSDFRKLLTSRTIALVTPLFIGLACLIYIPACYPRAVFAWGDYGEHYKTLESRRNVLWWVVIVALVINIVAGFFVGALQR